MKQVCLLCERSSPSNNLFCQETYCPAEMAPTILGYGDFLGDIEIVKLISTLRTSALYEARHEKKKVLLKIAHPGVHNKLRIEREAQILRNFQLQKILPPTLPTLLPPYSGSTIESDPYGKVMLQNHLLYYELFAPFEGEPLRDVLLKNSQLWINHVGWMIISLAEAVNFLHLQGFIHMALSPDTVLLRFDKDLPCAPRIQLFDLGLASDMQHLPQLWYEGIAPPAYIAPELLEGRRPATPPNYHTDVYGVGLVLYELLIGRPTYPQELRSDEIVINIVQSSQRLKMNRLEDVPAVARLASQATEWEPSRRMPNAADLAEALKDPKLFGEIPPEKKSRRPSRQMVLLTLLAIILIIAILIFAISQV